MDRKTRSSKKNNSQKHTIKPRSRFTEKRLTSRAGLIPISRL